MRRLHDFEEVRSRASKLAKKRGPFKLVLACAEDSVALKALRETTDLGLTSPILVGDAKKIIEAANSAEVDVKGFDIIDESSPQRAISSAVSLVAESGAHLLMRGRVSAVDFFRVALSSDAGLRQADQLCTHVGVFWPESLSRFIFVTDGGEVLDPDIGTVPKIIDNAIGVANYLGIMRPRVALLAAVETVYVSMPVAMGGAIIAKMAERGQIRGAYVDGPLSLDVALSPEAAREKGVTGKVAGKTDILVVNKIEVGNALCKSIFLFGKARSAGIVVGARVPIILSSRSEPVDAKINSIALASILAQ